MRDPLLISQAVAFKLVLAESLPLTPKPSAIENYINMLLYQFACQACLNLAAHLAKANFANGFFAPENDETYSCEAESVQHYCSAYTDIIYMLRTMSHLVRLHLQLTEKSLTTCTHKGFPTTRLSNRKFGKIPQK